MPSHIHFIVELSDDNTNNVGSENIQPLSLPSMPGNSHYIQAADQQLHYLQWGSGSKLLLAFHGYGRNADSFEVFASYLGTAYTILSIDLPQHGGSQWDQDAILLPQTLMNLVRRLMWQYKAEKVSLLGYSMGGRVCLSIVERMPECIEKVTLLATDGLTVNNYYYFFTGTYVGKKMFYNMLEKPDKYFTFLDKMKQWKLVNESQYKFVMHYLGDEGDRKKIGQRWPPLRRLIPSPSQLKRIIKDHAIPVTIYMGRYDSIMPPELAQKFKVGLDSVQLHILDKGHRIYDPSNAAEIAQSLL